MSVISILLPDLRGGGAERVNLSLAYEFQRLGYEVEFVLMRAEGEFLAEAQEHFLVHDLGGDRIRQVFKPLYRYLGEKKPAGMLASMWPLTAIAVLARIFSNGKSRIISIEHCNLSHQYDNRGWLHRACLRASLAFSCRFSDGSGGVSSGVTDELARLAFVRKRSLHIFYNPIPGPTGVDSSSVGNAYKLWGDNSSKRILSVGSFKHQKNHALLLKAFKTLSTDIDACLMLLGQGEMENQLRAQAKDYGIADRVIFAGFHSDPTPFYQTADLFVLSSDFEGLPTVLIEAMGCGVPVVSTNCHFGPAEILENGRYGKLVPVGDDNALAEAMQQALSEKVDIEILKKRAADFSPEKAAQKYLDVMFPVEGH